MQYQLIYKCKLCKCEFQGLIDHSPDMTTTLERASKGKRYHDCDTSARFGTLETKRPLEQLGIGELIGIREVE